MSFQLVFIVQLKSTLICHTQNQIIQAFANMRLPFCMHPLLLAFTFLDHQLTLEAELTNLQMYAHS